MPTLNQPRLQAILSLVEPARIIIDVGCDHGYITRAVGGIGSEISFSQLPVARDLPLVVADGLQPFSRVDLAIITGMGPHKILRILAHGPTPRQAIVHSPNKTGFLRQGLADAGFSIVKERLAPEARGFAEILKIVPGQEAHSGHALWFGPWLHQDPLYPEHLRRQLAHWRKIARHAPPQHPNFNRAMEWVQFLEARQKRLSPSV